jgi:hypothetical protein
MIPKKSVSNIVELLYNLDDDAADNDGCRFDRDSSGDRYDEDDDDVEKKEEEKEEVEDGDRCDDSCKASDGGVDDGDDKSSLYFLL